MISLGERLRLAREERGMSLRRAAETVGISASYLSLIERGKERPSQVEIYALASLLGEDPDQLSLVAGRLPDDVFGMLAEDPSLIEVLRLARQQRISGPTIIEIIASQIKIDQIS